MQFTTLHPLAVAASLSYVPWSDITTSSGAAMAVQAVAFRALSPRWAAEFLNRASGASWQIPAAGIAANDATGFAANLFDTPDGKLLAIRGTEVVAGSWGALASLLPGIDFGEEMRKDILEADLDILCNSGFAGMQTIALVNYLERLITPRGDLAPQWAFAPAPDAEQQLMRAAVAGGQPPPQLLWQPTPTAEGAPGLGLIASGETLQVVGHSLGGQLAAFALRLFPDLVSKAWLFNAPGIGALWAEHFIRQISPGLDAPPAPDFLTLGDRLVSIESEDSAPGDDRSLIASLGRSPSSLPGAIAIRTEVNSHSIDQIADNLALFAVLETLGPELSPVAAIALFDAASATAADSVESTVGALAALLNGERSFTPVAAGLAGYPPESFADRSAQLDALWRLQQIARANPAWQLHSLLGQSATELAALALDDAAVRYALRHTNPWYLGGDPALYARFADEVAPADDGPIPSREWLDRALLFEGEISRRLRDDTEFNGYGESLQRFTDRAQQLDFLTNPRAPQSPGMGPDPVRVMFGEDGPDALGALRGGTAPDRLYGGSGDDVLEGGAGADLLEGGPDQDLLFGGYGADTLLGGAGDDVLFGHELTAADDSQSDLLCGGPGQDIICAGPGDVVFDQDGILRVALGDEWRQISGLALRALPDAGLIRLFETPWSRPLLLAFNPDTRELRVGSVTVRDFTSGDLGILLPAAPPATPLPVLVGTGDADRLVGTAASEQLDALAGNDLVLAGAGDDKVLGGEGADRLLGDAGADELRGEAGRDVLLGGLEDDALFGGADDDVLGGDGGRDLLAGGTGNDLLAGGPGRDVMLGGDGDDLLVAGLVLGLPGEAWQVLRGAQPLTQILRDPRNVSLLQFGAIDRSEANFPTDPAGDVLYGERGDDFLIGSGGDDLLDGGPGDDTGLGGDGADRLRGGEGNDHLRGSGGNDVLEGNAGDDFLAGGGTDDDGRQPDGADLLYGGSGHDELQGGLDADRLYGEAGNDRLYGGPGADWLDGGPDDDRLYGDEDADTLLGEAGDDRLYGGAGEDQLSGGEGGDYLDGGDGRDLLGGDAGNDRLAGGAGDDQLFGGRGDDVLQGDAGADRLDGGPGNDYLYGGSGHDRYWISDTSGLDVIIDVEGDNGLWLPDAHSLTSWRAAADGADLLLSAGAAGLRVRDWAQSIDWLRFGARGMLDGAHLLQPELAGLVDTVTAPGPAGSAGDDEITLQLDGGVVTAGAGNDRYVLTAGAQVTIDDPRGQNTLVFPEGSSPASLRIGGDGARWQLDCGDSQVFCAPDTFTRYVFGNGGELSAADLQARVARELPLAPRVAERLGNQALAAGSRFEFALPAGAFIDPNPDASLSYHATIDGGRALPGWLHFDPVSASFSGRAPAAATLSLAVTLVATDETGLSATQQFGLDVLAPFTPGSAAILAMEALDDTRLHWLQAPGEPFGPPPLPVTAAGDLNGDGYDDLLHGDRLLWGSRAGVGAARGAAFTRIEGAPDWLTGQAGGARFDAERGDLDADGRQDLRLMPLDAGGTPGRLLASTQVWDEVLPYAALTDGAAPSDRPPVVMPALPTLQWAGLDCQLQRATPCGDFNGDGVGDVAVEALVGDSELPWLGVVFGADSASTPIDLATSAPARVFHLDCPPLAFYPQRDAGSVLAASGWGPLAALGDVNGDGLADLGLGAAPYLFSPGAAFGAVIFGRASGGSISLNALDGHNGFLLAWPEPGTGYARPHAVRAAGDVNGDAFDDVLLVDQATGGSGVLYGRATFAGELLTGTAAADFLEAHTPGTVSAGDGDDTVRITAPGDTTVYTGFGQNTVVVDAPTGATVRVFGGPGADVYQIQNGAVRVLLNDPDGAPNTLRLPAGFDATSLVPRQGSVLLAAGPDAPEIHLENVDFDDVLGGPRSVEFIEFADGRRLRYAELIARGFDVAGTAGPDRLTGSNVVDRLSAGAGDDWLRGGAGDDTLDGGAGDDAYQFGAGSGADRLRDGGGEDRLMFEDLLAPARLQSRQAGLDLVLIRPGGEQVTIDGWYANPSARIETLCGADGVPLSLPALVNRAPVAGRLDLVQTTAGQPFEWALPGAAAIDRDPFDRLRWQLDDAQHTGLTLDPTTGRLRGTPSTPGDFTLVCQASDDFGASCSVLVPLRVVAAPHPGTGSERADVLRGTALADRLRGLGGDDVLWGGAADDVLEGGEGADRLYGEGGADWLYGGNGADRLDGGPGRDRLFGDSGNDWLSGAAGADTLRGGDGADSLLGGADEDWLYGGNGGDCLDGGAGRDRLFGDSGNDRLSGAAGADTLEGGAGDDWLDGGAGSDVLAGGAGNDRYCFDRRAGRDVIRNGDAAGIDELRISGCRRDELIIARAGNDLRIAIRHSDAQVSIERWFAAPAARLDRILLDDGQSLSTRDIDVLVQAMARFTSPMGLGPPAGASVLSPSEIPLAAVWQ